MQIFRAGSGATINVGPTYYRSGASIYTTGVTYADLIRVKLIQSATSANLHIRSGRWVHMTRGNYKLTITGASLTTPGNARIYVECSGGTFLPIFEDIFLENTNFYDCRAIGKWSGVTIGGVTRAMIKTGTYAGVTISGINLIRPGGLAGVTIAGVTRIQSLRTSGNTVSGLNIIKTSGNTISGINLIRPGGLAGVTIAGVTRIQSIKTSGNTISGLNIIRTSGNTISGINLIRPGGLAGVTIAGVTRAALAGIKPSIYAGVTISGVNLAGLKAGKYSGVTISGVSIVSPQGVDLIHDEVVDGVLTHRQSIRLQNSAAFGKSTGGAGTTATFRDVGDTKDRIAADVNAKGQRTAVVLDPS